MILTKLDATRAARPSRSKRSPASPSSSAVSGKSSPTSSPSTPTAWLPASWAGTCSASSKKTGTPWTKKTPGHGAQSRTSSFTLEDYMQQMGDQQNGLHLDLLKMIPGMGSRLKAWNRRDKIGGSRKEHRHHQRHDPDEQRTGHLNAIPSGASQRAAASRSRGQPAPEQFEQARGMMKQMMGGGKRRMKMPFGLVTHRAGAMKIYSHRV